MLKQNLRLQNTGRRQRERGRVVESQMFREQKLEEEKGWLVDTKRIFGSCTDLIYSSGYGFCKKLRRILDKEPIS